MGAAPTPKFTAEEYLALDRQAELKSEFHDGEIFPISAASLRHGRIASGIAGALRTHLRGSRCREAISPVRVRVSASQFVYPDILVYCGEPQLTDEHVDTLLNPRLIVEVLSPSTQDYDYGGKFALYRRIASFEEYLLVSQSEAKVEVYRKQSATTWTLETVTGVDAVLELKSLAIEIPLAEIYEGIELD